MHTHIKTLFFGMVAMVFMCVCVSSAFAAPPKMTEYFRYEDPLLQPEKLDKDKDLFVLPTFSVEGKRVITGELSLSSESITRRPDLEPRHKHVLGFEIKIIEDTQPEDLLSTVTFAGPAELVQKLQNTATIGGINIYIKSGLSWRVDNDLSFVAPYARGRLFGAAISYKSPTSWSRDKPFFFHR